MAACILFCVSLTHSLLHPHRSRASRCKLNWARRVNSVWILHVRPLRRGKEWSLLISVSNMCVCEQGTSHIIMSSYKLKCLAANRLGIWMGHHGHLSVIMTFFPCRTINSINLHNLSQSSENNGIIWVKMIGVQLKSMLRQSLHYLTNAFNWILMSGCLFLESPGQCADSG